MVKVVSHTPVEVEKIGLVLRAGPWLDAMRRPRSARGEALHMVELSLADWARADKGRRLDHVWLSEKLAPALAGMRVFREARGWERPSDHVPVIVDLEL